MTFMTLLIGVFDNSTLEKSRHYPHPRPIIERTVAPSPPNQKLHHVPNPEPHHPLLAHGTNDMSAPGRNTKDSRAASTAKADAENRKPERNIRPERLAQLREPRALAHQRQNYEEHGIAAALGLVGGLAVNAVDSALTTLTPQLRPVAGVDNQSAAPTPQQKPQPGSMPLPQSILTANPLGPASQFQPPSAAPAHAASGIAEQLGAQPLGNQPPSNQAQRNQAPGTQQQVATPPQQQTAPQVSATPAPYAAIANDDDRPAASRGVRHPRNRYGPDQYGAWSAGATQRFDARGYDHLYNSYGEPRLGPYARYRIPRSPYPMQTRPPRREQYWGGGFYGGYRYGD
jgi:hypothetical protein